MSDAGPSAYDVEQAARRDAYDDTLEASLPALLSATPETMRTWIRSCYVVSFHLYRAAGLVAVAAQEDAERHTLKASLRLIVAGKPETVQSWLTTVYDEEYRSAVRVAERRQEKRGGSTGSSASSSTGGSPWQRLNNRRKE
jgi:hypothetical protein